MKALLLGFSVPVLLAAACGGSGWKPVRTAEARPAAVNSGFVRPAEAAWVSCAQDSDCGVLSLGGEPYCVGRRGVMAVRKKFTREAIRRYGAPDQQLLHAPTEQVTCAHLEARCIQARCTLVRPAE